MKELIIYTEGQKEIIAKGTDQEVLANLKAKAYDLTSWIRDQGAADEIENLDSVLEDIAKAEILDDINLDVLDYSWWTIEIA